MLKPIRVLRSQLLCGLVLVLLVVAIPGCSSQSPDSTEQLAESDRDYLHLWKTLKPAPIVIPPDSGGQALLTRNFYFIVDGSGSMRERPTQKCGGDQKFADKMAGAQWAINKFLEQVPEDVNIGLYVFDSYGKREVVPLGSGNRESFFKAIANIDAGGGTPLTGAIRVGTNRLVEQYKKQLGYGEFRLVVITDGEAEDIPGAAVYAARCGIPIYAIGLCVEPNHPLRTFSVSYQAADSFADLSQSLKDTLAELPNYDATQFEKK